jgi:hypothetical protein
MPTGRREVELSRRRHIVEAAPSAVLETAL